MLLHRVNTERSDLLIVFLLCSTLPGTAKAQSLNDVVTDQLSNSCSELLGIDDNRAVLTGPLQVICEPPDVGGPGGPLGAAGSTGGGAAISAALPNILRRRLKEEETAKGNEGAASGDYILSLSRSIELYLSGEYQSLNRDITTFEDGYDSDIWRVTTGADYYFSQSMLIGAAFDYRHQQGDYAGGGDFTLDFYGALVYADFAPINGFFIQIIGSYSHQNNERNRFASFKEKDGTLYAGFVNGDYQGEEYSASIQSGYDFAFRSITISPIIGLDWIRNNYASFAETGNTGLELRFAKDRRVSLQSRLGFLGSVAISEEFAVIVPQLGVSWLHEFENDQRDIQFNFVGDTRNKLLTFQNEKPDRDFLEISAGTSVVFAQGVQAFVNYRAIASHRYFNGHSASFGMRMEF